MAQVILPHLGMTMKEAEVSEWLKAVGDTVEEGEQIAEVTTEKLVTEIIAPCSGTLSKILVEEGDSAECGAALAEIEEA